MHSANFTLIQSPTPFHGSEGRRLVARYTPCFFVLREEEVLQPVLHKDFRYFVEVTNINNAQQALKDIQDTFADFAVSITTRSAYYSRLSLSLTDHIHERFFIPIGAYYHIQTCVHEAILNAIIHGNLGLKLNSDNIDSFEGYYNAIEKCLEDPAHANKRINIATWKTSSSLRIMITDEGKGFDIPQEHEISSVPHGRGFMMIRSLASRIWQEECRNSLYMQFNYEQDEPYAF